MFADPFELIKSFPPGMASIGRAKEKPDHPWTSIFLVREEEKYIRGLGKYPQIEVKTALVAENNVAAVFVQFRINMDWDYLYDCWVNCHAPGNEDILSDFSRQNIFVFKFFDSRQDRRTVAIPNHLKGVFAGYAEAIGKLPPWSMQEFDALKERIYSRYPTGRDMWLKFFD